MEVQNLPKGISIIPRTLHPHEAKTLRLRDFVEGCLGQQRPRPSQKAEEHSEWKQLQEIGVGKNSHQSCQKHLHQSVRSSFQRFWCKKPLARRLQKNYRFFFHHWKGISDSWPAKSPIRSQSGLRLRNIFLQAYQDWLCELRKGNSEFLRKN